MARSPRLFIPEATYHVYCRTARGEMVFSDREQAAEFVEVVADVKRLHGFEILAWCLMDNDDQLIEPGEADDAVDYRGDPVPCSGDPGFDLNDATALVCKATSVPIADLRGRSRAIDVARARKTLAVIAVDHLEFSVADVAQFLQKHPGSVSRWLETRRGSVDRPESV